MTRWTIDLGMATLLLFFRLRVCCLWSAEQERVKTYVVSPADCSKDYHRLRDFNFVIASGCSHQSTVINNILREREAVINQGNSAEVLTESSQGHRSYHA